MLGRPFATPCAPAGFLAGLLAVLTTVGCQSIDRPLVVDSEPPGAAVILNGVDSGFATPCVLDLARQRVKSVELRLAGYDTERRVLREGGWSQAVLWKDMAPGKDTWRFPLFLPAKDFFLPVERSTGPSPPRLYVRLERSGR